ncbi:MAG: DeoR/GlpR transcriptional regulator [Cyclobacteriaceae bacterium]|nr:DeoR/GlpR transcriptional regulator [Cyclobacteriaceae bacterium]
MLKIERHSIILDELRAHHRVKSSTLCEILDVSEDTVRRDLNELEKRAPCARSAEEPQLWLSFPVLKNAK